MPTLFFDCLITVCPDFYKCHCLLQQGKGGAETEKIFLNYLPTTELRGKPSCQLFQDAFLEFSKNTHPDSAGQRARPCARPPGTLGAHSRLPQAWGRVQTPGNELCFAYFVLL